MKIKKVPTIYTDAIILIDMDGVIADFFRHILPKTKTKLDSYDDWPLGSNEYEKLFGMTYDEVLQNCDHNFWADIKPTPWMESLMKFVKETGAETHILTSPPHVSEHENIMPHHVGGTVEGKLEWILKHAPDFYHEGRVTFCWKKYIGASNRNILLDDSETNIDLFNERGGLGILIPGLHNRRHEEYGEIMNDFDSWIINELGNIFFLKTEKAT